MRKSQPVALAKPSAQLIIVLLRHIPLLETPEWLCVTIHCLQINIHKRVKERPGYQVALSQNMSLIQPQRIINLHFFRIIQAVTQFVDSDRISINLENASFIVGKMMAFYFFKAFVFLLLLEMPKALSIISRPSRRKA